MFRPNRIGTPIIHTLNQQQRLTTFTMAENLNTTNVFQANVISGTPLLDFGEQKLLYIGGAVNITALSHWALAQQFTLTPPINGDTCGIELNGGIAIGNLPNQAITPFIGKVADASGSLLGAVTLGEFPSLFQTKGNDTTTADTMLTHSYKEQVVISGDKAYLTGTFIHGFIFWNQSTANVETFSINLGLRQLNDQQNIGYRDTRR